MFWSACIFTVSTNNSNKSLPVTLCFVMHVETIVSKHISNKQKNTERRLISNTATLPNSAAIDKSLRLLPFSTVCVPVSTMIPLPSKSPTIELTVLGDKPVSCASSIREILLACMICCMTKLVF